MKDIEAPALLAFEADIVTRTFSDWLVAHTSFLKPLHRYEGILALERTRLIFKGTDVKTKEFFEMIIAKDEIEQLYCGFDEVYSVFETRGLGLLWKPLRITFAKAGKEAQIYLVINFRWGVADNKQWFELLKAWLS